MVPGMTNLIRCRGAISEIAGLFDAEADLGLLWQPIIWPGESVLVIIPSASGRRLQRMSWGLPSSAFADPRPRSRRATIFGSDMVDRSGGIVSHDLLARCLIVIESFAYPEGVSGQRTRTWGGLWDEPLAAWAGVCVPGAQNNGCAGILSPANALFSKVSGHLPLLLPPEERAPWLDGASPLSLTTSYPETAWYLERSDERWSNGLPIGEA